LFTYAIDSKAQELTANTKSTEQINNPKQDKQELKKSIVLRLDELKSIDKSKLTSAEKKELRKEVRAIKKDASNNGIYISTTAIIVIILIIIIL